MNRINFKENDYIRAHEVDLDEVRVTCVPSKEKYGEVAICFGDGMLLDIGSIECPTSLSFDDRKKIGYEIAKRWNEGKK